MNKEKEKEKAQQVSVSTRPAEVQQAAQGRVLQPIDEFEHFFDRLMGRGWLRPFDLDRPMFRDLLERFESRMPKIDVIDRTDDVLVRAEVPGTERQDLDISVADNTLTIKGAAGGEPRETKGDHYYRCEISRGAFSRSVTLPAKVNSAKASATLKGGVLEITLPKVEESKRQAIKVD